MTYAPIPLSAYNDPVIIDSQKAQMGLKYSYSEFRWDPKGLDEGVILPGLQVAVFIDDVFNAFMDQVDFYLDGPLHNTEASAPWDFDTTDGFGNATLFTFTSGLHTITADITFSGGFVTPNPYTVSATFQVL